MWNFSELQLWRNEVKLLENRERSLSETAFSGILKSPSSRAQSIYLSKSRKYPLKPQKSFTEMSSFVPEDSTSSKWHWYTRSCITSGINGVSSTKHAPRGGRVVNHAILRRFKFRDDIRYAYWVSDESAPFLYIFYFIFCDSVSYSQGVNTYVV